MVIYADYHTHTRYSHGKGTVLDNVAQAAKIGLEEIGISDHGPAHLLGIGIKNLQVLDQTRDDINQSMQVYPSVRVRLGVEANIVSRQGDLDITSDYLAKLDYVQAGLHVLVRPLHWGDGLNRMAAHYLRRLGSGFAGRSRFLNTEALINAVYRYRIDVITHPNHRFNIDTRVLARACAQRNTAFEINTSHKNMTLALIDIAACEGVDFVIGSDAHDPQRVGDFASGLALAREAGLSARQIRNARCE